MASKGGICIQGTPLHTSSEELIQEYSTSIQSYLVTEASNSTGSYILIDYENQRAISSTGYEGGYITPEFEINTKLAPLLDVDAAFSAGGIRRYLDTKAEHYWPFQSLFEDIYQIPPGVIVESSETDDDVTFTSYVSQASAEPPSFRDALHGALQPLDEDTVEVMFSGGADSLALYHAADSVLDADVTATTVDIGPNTNSVSRATTVANDVGFDVDIIDYDWPPSDPDVIAHISRELRTDLCQPLAPQYALVGRTTDLVLSGQNMDTILASDMRRRQTRLLDHIRYTHDYKAPLRQFALNYPKSKLANQHPWTAAALSKALTKVLPHETTFTAQQNAFTAGFLSTDLPFRINKNDDPAILWRDAARVVDSAKDVDLTKHAHYMQGMHNAAKVIVGTDLPGAGVQLPAIWGRMVSRYLPRGASLAECFTPKADVYQYLKNELDYSYLRDSYTEEEYRREKRAEQEFKNSMTPTVLHYHEEVLQPDSSVLLQTAPERVHDRVTQSFDRVRSLLADGEGTLGDIWEGHRLLNLELLSRQLT